jgi:hypothetical protein
VQVINQRTVVVTLAPLLYGIALTVSMPSVARMKLTRSALAMSPLTNLKFG